MALLQDDRPKTTKNVTFYKSGDDSFRGIQLPVNQRKYRTLDALLDDLSYRIPGLPYGVRRLATSRGKHHVKNLEDLKHGGSYVCTDKTKPKKIPGVKLQELPGMQNYRFQSHNPPPPIPFNKKKRKSKSPRKRAENKSPPPTTTQKSPETKQKTRIMPPLPSFGRGKKNDKSNDRSNQYVVAKGENLRRARRLKKSTSEKNLQPAAENVNDFVKSSQHTPRSNRKRDSKDSVINGFVIFPHFSDGTDASKITYELSAKDKELTIRYATPLRPIRSKSLNSLRREVAGSAPGTPGEADRLAESLRPLDESKLKHVQRGRLIKHSIDTDEYTLPSSNSSPSETTEKPKKKKQRRPETATSDRSLSRSNSNVRRSKNVEDWSTEEHQKAATTIQRHYRGFKGRRDQKRKEDAAIRIQSRYRGYKTRHENGIGGKGEISGEPRKTALTDMSAGSASSEGTETTKTDGLHASRNEEETLSMDKVFPQESDDDFFKESDIPSEKKKHHFSTKDSEKSSAPSPADVDVLDIETEGQKLVRDAGSSPRHSSSASGTSPATDANGMNSFGSEKTESEAPTFDSLGDSSDRSELESNWKPGDSIATDPTDSDAESDDSTRVQSPESPRLSPREELDEESEKEDEKENLITPRQGNIPSLTEAANAVLNPEESPSNDKIQSQEHDNHLLYTSRADTSIETAAVDEINTPTNIIYEEEKVYDNPENDVPSTEDEQSAQKLTEEEEDDKKTTETSQDNTVIVVKDDSIVDTHEEEYAETASLSVNNLEDSSNKILFYNEGEKVPGTSYNSQSTSANENTQNDAHLDEKAENREIDIQLEDQNDENDAAPIIRGRFSVTPASLDEDPNLSFNSSNGISSPLAQSANVEVAENLDSSDKSIKDKPTINLEPSIEQEEYVDQDAHYVSDTEEEVSSQSNEVLDQVTVKNDVKSFNESTEKAEKDAAKEEKINTVSDEDKSEPLVEQENEDPERTEKTEPKSIEPVSSETGTLLEEKKQEKDISDLPEESKEHKENSSSPSSEEADISTGSQSELSAVPQLEIANDAVNLKKTATLPEQEEIKEAEIASSDGELLNNLADNIGEKDKNYAEKNSENLADNPTNTIRKQKEAKQVEENEDNAIEFAKTQPPDEQEETVTSNKELEHAEEESPEEEIEKKEETSKDVIVNEENEQNLESENENATENQIAEPNSITESSPNPTGELPTTEEDTGQYESIKPEHTDEEKTEKQSEIKRNEDSPRKLNNDQSNEATEQIPDGKNAYQELISEEEHRAEETQDINKQSQEAQVDDAEIAKDKNLTKNESNTDQKGNTLKEDLDITQEREKNEDENKEEDEKENKAEANFNAMSEPLRDEKETNSKENESDDVELPYVTQTPEDLDLKEMQETNITSNEDNTFNLVEEDKVFNEEGEEFVPENTITPPVFTKEDEQNSGSEDESSQINDQEAAEITERRAETPFEPEETTKEKKKTFIESSTSVQQWKDENKELDNNPTLTTTVIAEGNKDENFQEKGSIPSQNEIRQVSEQTRTDASSSRNVSIPNGSYIGDTSSVIENSKNWTETGASNTPASVYTQSTILSTFDDEPKREQDNQKLSDRYSNIDESDAESSEEQIEIGQRDSSMGTETEEKELEEQTQSLQITQPELPRT